MDPPTDVAVSLNKFSGDPDVPWNKPTGEYGTLIPPLAAKAISPDIADVPERH